MKFKRQDSSCLFYNKLTHPESCMFYIFVQNFFKMKILIKNILPLLIFAGFLFVAFSFPAYSGSSPGDCDIDTSRISVVEFTVLGMDSVTINDVQDKLDAECGVSFNFACWSDTVVFIEYDSLLTNKTKLMAAIREMGFKPSIRHAY